MPKQKIIGSVVCDPPVAKAGRACGSRCVTPRAAAAEGVLHVGPGSTHDATTFTGVCDDSVMADLRLSADLWEDGSVRIKGRGRIYESEDPDDGVGGEIEVSFDVASGAIGAWKGMKLVNEDDDIAVFDFDVLNSQDKF